jgi:mannose-6-phosphate isomerase-like protein (cupin superfamily)
MQRQYSTGKTTKMTTLEEIRFEMPVRGKVIDDDWLQAQPGEWLAVRLSSADTDGRYSVIELVAQPGSGPPLHIHHNEDEHFVVLDGIVRFVCDGRTFDATAGSAFTVRKGVPHAWANLSGSNIRMLGMFAPGGIERCFLELAEAAADELEAIANAYGCAIVGPPIR